MRGVLALILIAGGAYLAWFVLRGGHLPWESTAAQSAGARSGIDAQTPGAVGGLMAGIGAAGIAAQAPGAGGVVTHKGGVPGATAGPMPGAGDIPIVGPFIGAVIGAVGGALGF